MKLFKKILAYLAVLLVVFSVLAFATGKTYLFKAVIYNFSAIDDYKKFDNNIVTVGTAKPWAIASD